VEVNYYTGGITLETMKSEVRSALHVSLRKNKQEEKPIAQELMEPYLYFSKSANLWMPKHKTFLY